MLQELFAEEMNKVDDTFFIRLNESRLHIEDKSTAFKHPLFKDDTYNDIDYYKDFPSIFHLRKELIQNPKVHDIRLVYLTLHHLLKSRGHFLIDGSLEAAKNFKSSFDAMLTDLSEELNLDVLDMSEKIRRKLRKFYLIRP